MHYKGRIMYTSLKVNCIRLKWRIWKKMGRPACQLWPRASSFFYKSLIAAACNSLLQCTWSDLSLLTYSTQYPPIFVNWKNIYNFCRLHSDFLKLECYSKLPWNTALNALMNTIPIRLNVRNKFCHSELSKMAIKVIKANITIIPIWNRI